MQALLNQLAQFTSTNYPESSKKEDGLWFMFSDYDTGIKARDVNKVHPCFIPGDRTIKNGRVDVWFRSTTRQGSQPEYLKHPPHSHPVAKGCPCKSEAHITLRGFKSLPAEILLKSPPRCVESNQEWLASFQRCYTAIFARRVSR